MNQLAPSVFSSRGLTLQLLKIKIYATDYKDIVTLNALGETSSAKMHLKDLCLCAPHGPLSQDSAASQGGLDPPTSITQGAASARLHITSLLITNRLTGFVL